MRKCRVGVTATAGRTLTLIMGKTWTQETQAAFERERNRYLTGENALDSPRIIGSLKIQSERKLFPEVDDPHTEPWESLSEDAKVAYLKTLPKKIKSEEYKRLTSQAWNIGKRPVAKFYAPRGGTLQLPKGMNGKTGYDTASFHIISLLRRRANGNDGRLQVKFRKHDDLNTIVFNHYNSRIEDPSTYPGVNYVSSDGLLVKK